MEKKEIYLEYLREYLKNQYKNRSLIIDGDAKSIAGIMIEDLLNLDFQKENVEDELCIVHTTDYSPISSKAIISPYIGKKLETDLVKNIQFYSKRDSFHSALNGVVPTNNGGEWNDKLYTIIEPFKTIKSKVLGFGPIDTFFEDKIDLTENGIVLVHEDNKGKLTEEDKKMNIVYYRGNQRNAINLAIIMMGYKPQMFKTSSFINEENNLLLEKFQNKNEYGPYLHSFTKYHIMSGNLQRRDVRISALRGEIFDSTGGKEITVEELKYLFQIFFGKENGSYGNHTIKTEKEAVKKFMLEYGISIDEKGIIKLLDVKESRQRINPYFDEKNGIFRYGHNKALLDSQFFENMYLSFPIECLNSKEILESKIFLEWLEKLKEIVSIDNEIFIALKNQGEKLGSIELIHQQEQDSERELFIEELFPNNLMSLNYEIFGARTIMFPFNQKIGILPNMKNIENRIKQVINTLQKANLLEVQETKIYK